MNIELKFRAWDEKNQRFIYSETSSGTPRLGWFFANTKGMRIEQLIDGEYKEV